LRADPGLPLQTLQLVGCLAPQSGDLYLISETLLENGISTTWVNAGGTLRIDRVITTYQFDAFATPDTSYLNVERMFLIMYTARYVRSILESMHG
jgi:phage tail sheath gpL-like